MLSRYAFSNKELYFSDLFSFSTIVAKELSISFSLEIGAKDCTSIWLTPPSHINEVFQAKFIMDIEFRVPIRPSIP